LIRLLSRLNFEVVLFTESFINMHFSALLAAEELIDMASTIYSLVHDFSDNNFFDVFHFEIVDILRKDASEIKAKLNR